MKKNLLCASIACILASQASAVTFSTPKHSKSLAMGGAGVTSTSTAGILNPASLASWNAKKSIEITLPSASIGVSDEDEFISQVDDFQDSGVIDNLQDAIDNSNGFGSYMPVADAAVELSRELDKIDARSLMANGSLLASIASPSSEQGGIGWGLTLSGTGMIDGSVHYEDGDTLSALASDLSAFESCYADLLNCDPSELSADYVDPVTGEVIFDTDIDLDSYVKVRAVSFTELAFSLAYQTEFGGKRVALGVTPKYVRASLFNYTANVDTADVEDLEDLATHEDSVNVDLGAIFEIQDGLVLGFSVRDLISQEYESAENSIGGRYIVKVKPQTRIGLSYETSWATIAVDVDANSAYDALGYKDQKASLGVEINAFDLAQIRMGYQHDLIDRDDSLASLGLGLSPFGLYLDIGVAGNSEQVVASAQTGFRW